MTYLMRSQLLFSLIVAALVLFVVLLAPAPLALYSALAAAPEGQDALNVERLSSYDESEGGPCCRQVVAVEEYAYVVGSTIVYTDPPSSKNLVDVYNISDAQNPVKTRSFGVGFEGVTSRPAYGYTINDLFVSGDGATAFIAFDVHSLYSLGGEFWALNLGTNPPSKLCSFYIPDAEGRFAHTVVGHGQYAYVGTNNNITILDTSTADANGKCQKVGQYSGSGASDLERVGNLLYLSSGESFQALSISNPQSPSFVTSFTLPENIYDLTANAAGYVFAATSDGVFIVDTFNLGNVRVVGTYGIGSTDSVTLDGAHLYVGTYSHGLRVVDVSDPAAPTEVGYYVDTGENRSSYFLNVFFADGFLHTPDGIYRYRPDGSEPCPQSQGPDPCRPLEFKVTQPTVHINNQPVAVNNSQPLRPGDKITLGPPRGAGETRVRCSEAQYFVALARYADSEEEGLGVISVLEIASYHEELVQKFCTSPPTAAAAEGGEPDLVFSLESGDVQAQGQVPNLLLNLSTTSATVQSTGMNIFNVAHLPDTGATRVGALRGTVQVVPTNSALPPVTLQRNEQVTVTASEISPVTAYGSSVFLPLIAR